MSAYAELLDDALTVLERESPMHARVLADAAAAIRPELVVNGEAWRPHRADWRAPQADGAPDAPRTLRVEADATAILELLEDRLTLIEALRGRRLRVTGHRDAVAAAERAMRAFLHGLVRSRSGPALLERLYLLVRGDVP